MALMIPCDLGAIREASRQVRSFLAQQNISELEQDAWELICAEAGNNAVTHTPVDKQGLKIEFILQITPDSVELRVVDHTPGFDFPNSPKLPDELDEHGRGLFLMSILSDGVRYLRGKDENHLILRKLRLSGSNAEKPPEAPLGSTVAAAELESMVQTMTEELAASFESLSAIFRFTSELNRGGTGSEFTDRWLRELMSAINADWFVLRLVDFTGSRLQVDCISRPDVSLEALTLEAAAQTNRPTEIHAALGRQDVWFDDLNPLAVGDPLCRFGTPYAGLSHPIYVSGELVGVLSIGRYSTQVPFVAGQVNIIHTFADFLGIQVRNHRIQDEYLKARLVTRELEIAASIQRSLLPERLPEPAGYRLASYSESASKVGGDFFDVIESGEDGLLLAIADVMGKGVPAAMFAAIFRSHLHARPDLAPRPGDFLNWLNRALYADLDRVDMFVTAQIVFIDWKAGELRMASAGHCPLLMGSSSGSVVELSSDGMPLGIRGDTQFEQIRVPIAPGLRLVMFTDGLIEARSAAGELLGLEPVKQWLSEVVRTSLSVRDARQALVDLARRFQGEAPASDDLTFLLVAQHPE
jgi:serine phosphatase RsbU (regulator of sigma subunit)/anti-sigma regulatory factor (Ser/Thr protein kinase)